MMDKKIYISLLAAFSLTSCGAGNWWENVTGSRSTETVQGMRRVPELNAQNRIAPITPNSPPVAGAIYAAPTANTPASNNPFDSYDESGNPMAGKPQIVEKPQSANVPALRKSFSGNTVTATETSGSGNIPLSTAKQPVIQEKRSVDTSKDLRSATLLKNEAPVYSAPKPVENVGEPKPVVSSTGGKGLASVPEKPSQFEGIKKSYGNNISDLQESRTEASKSKDELDKEIANPDAVNASATPAASTALTTEATSTANAQDLIIPLAPPVADRADEGSLTSKDTDTSTIIPNYNNSNAADSTGAIPVSSLPEIKVDSAGATYTVLPEAPKQQENTQNLSNLPDPETIKTMRPSRYSERVRTNQNPHH